MVFSNYWFSYRHWFYEGAILAGVVLIAVLTLFTPLKDYLNSKTKIADYYLVLVL